MYKLFFHHKGIMVFLLSSMKREHVNCKSAQQMTKNVFRGRHNESIIVRM